VQKVPFDFQKLWFYGVLGLTEFDEYSCMTSWFTPKLTLAWPFTDERMLHLPKITIAWPFTYERVLHLQKKH
jgi:hypothetical protein